MGWSESGVCDSTRIKLLVRAQWYLSKLRLLFEGASIQRRVILILE